MNVILYFGYRYFGISIFSPSIVWFSLVGIDEKQNNVGGSYPYHLSIYLFNLFDKLNQKKECRRFLLAWSMMVAIYLSIYLVSLFTDKPKARRTGHHHQLRSDSTHTHTDEWTKKNCLIIVDNSIKNIHCYRSIVIAVQR